MQPYDLVMLTVMILATVFGAWKGAAWQVASLGSLVISFFVAMHFSGPLAPYLSDREWNRFAAMLILYVVTSMAIWVVFRLVSGAIDRLKLKEFDRQIGGTIGFAKGVLLCLVITFFVVTLSEPARQAIYKSPSGRVMTWVIQRADVVMPQEVRSVVGKYLKQLEDDLNRPPEATPARSTDLAPSRPAEPAKEMVSGLLKAQAEELWKRAQSANGGQPRQSPSGNF